MGRKFRKILALTALAATLAGPARADLLADSLAASRAGSQATAIADWQTLAAQGNATAQGLLGDALITGAGIPPSPQQALHWLQLAANQNNALAEFDLGAAYETGTLGLPQDLGTAAYWYQLAAAQGDIRSENNLAQMYYAGRGVPQDYAQAFKLYKAAADKGELRAMFAVGGMYALGQAVPRNDELAYIWMSLAASHETDPVLGQRFTQLRDAQAEKLTPAQLADGKNRVAHWCSCHGDP